MLWSLPLMIAAAPARPPEAPRLVISVKVVKAEAGWCSKPATLEVISRADGERPLGEETPAAADNWSVLTGDGFQGENEWEVYWNLQAAAPDVPLPHVRLTCEGVDVRRVIVGRTDVPFQRDGDSVQCDLVNDVARGQLIQTVLPDPAGGLPIDLHHNWEMRRAGPYRKGPWPASRIAAQNNYLFAAREALKIMGGFGSKPRDNPFDGTIVLEGFETGFTRGHADFPPHFHIMLYPPGYTGAQVPHFYLDDEGHVTSNAFVEIGRPDSGRNFGPGEWCSLKDLHGVVGLELMVTADGGVAMRKTEGQDVLTLRGVAPEGAVEKVGVYRGDDLLLTAAVTDDAQHGLMTIALEGRAAGLASSTERVEYDPFTGRLLRQRPAQ
jgi:hypothetical protein